MHHREIENSAFLKTNTCVGFIVTPAKNVPISFFFFFERIIIKKTLSQQCLPRIPACLWTNSVKSGGRFKSGVMHTSGALQVGQKK